MKPTLCHRCWDQDQPEHHCRDWAWRLVTGDRINGTWEKVQCQCQCRDGMLFT